MYSQSVVLEACILVQGGYIDHPLFGAYRITLLVRIVLLVVVEGQVVDRHVVGIVDVVAAGRESHTARSGADLDSKQVLFDLLGRRVELADCRFPNPNVMIQILPSSDFWMPSTSLMS